MCAVVFGQLGGVGDKGGEEALDDLSGVAVGVLHDGRVVEVVVKEILGGGAFGFELRAEGRQAVGRAADIGQGCGAESSYAGAHFVQQIGDQRVQDALDGFVHGELGRGGGVLDENSVVEAAEQWHGFADLGEGKDAGVEAVIEIGGEIGDFVGQIDELGFKGRELVEEVLGQLRVGGGGVIAGVLDDALPYAKGEVEAAKGGVPLLEPRNDAQGVEVVVEAQAVGMEGVVGACSPAWPKGGCPISWASARASASSALRPRAAAKVREIWATSSVWVKRLRK